MTNPYWTDWYSGWGWFLWFGVMLLLSSSAGNRRKAYRLQRAYRALHRNEAFDVIHPRHARGQSGANKQTDEVERHRTGVEAMKFITRPLWDTSASGNDPQTLPAALDDLGGHAHECEAANGRWFDVLRQIDAFQTFLTPRPISVIVAVLAFALTVLWMWR